MVSRTIVAVQHKTLDEFRILICFFVFFNLIFFFFAFSQKRKGKTTQVKAGLCAHYISVPKGNVAYQMENNGQKWPTSSERQDYTSFG